MKIDTVKDFGQALRNGPYAWPGGYPMFFITADGGTLSFATAWKERSNIVQAILDDNRRGGWRVVAADVNWEDAELFDDHSGKRIESAYAEDDAKGEPEKTPKSYLDWTKRGQDARDDEYKRERNSDEARLKREKAARERYDELFALALDESRAYGFKGRAAYERANTVVKKAMGSSYPYKD